MFKLNKYILYLGLDGELIYYLIFVLLEEYCSKLLSDIKLNVHTSTKEVQSSIHHGVVSRLAHSLRHDSTRKSLSLFYL